MQVNSELIKILCVVAYGVLPFLLGAIAIWLKSRNAKSRHVFGIAMVFAIIGIFGAIAIFSNIRISKYLETDITFGIVFVIWFAAAGGILGAVADRVRFGRRSSPEGRQIDDTFIA